MAERSVMIPRYLEAALDGADKLTFEEIIELATDVWDGEIQATERQIRAWLKQMGWAERWTRLDE